MKRRLTVCIPALVLLLLCACSAPPDPRPSVILVLIDTLRADALGSGGSDTAVSPFLDSFSRRGVLFSNTVVQASWTKPSVASLFTSLYGGAHGVRIGRFGDAAQGLQVDGLNPSVTTLAELFSAAGWDTIGVQSNVHVHERFGFGQGFRKYGLLPAPDHNADAVNRTVDDYMHDADSPYFLFIHYLDPHNPYKPPQPYRSIFVDRLGTAEEIAAVYTQRSFMETYFALAMTRVGLERSLSPNRISESTLRVVRALYQGEIRYTDARLEQALRRFCAGLDLSRDYLMVLSDHGEAFYEHGQMGHGQSVYEEEIRVPMMIAGPGIPAGRVDAGPVELVDVLPTFAELCGLEFPDECQGRSLAESLRSADSVEEAPVYSEFYCNFESCAYTVLGVRRGRWKLVRDVVSGVQELYDLRLDPGEQVDIAANFPQPALELGDLLDRRAALDHELEKRFGAVQNIELDEEMILDLQSLGYIR